MVNVEYSEAIVEILEILQHSDDGIMKKIPPHLIEFWQKNKSATYKPVLNHDLTLNEMNLKAKTKSLIAMIYVNFLCDDAEKNDIRLTVKSNEEMYQQQLRKKCAASNVRKEKNEKMLIKPNDINTLFIPKETVIKRIVNKFKMIFKRK